jgi:phage shock protein A
MKHYETPQTALERKLLEEARDARRKEREGFNAEVSAERRALAQEHADMQRQLEASRAELMALKSRCEEEHHDPILAFLVCTALSIIPCGVPLALNPAGGVPKPRPPLPSPVPRVIEYEARASAALQQAIDEESRVGQAQRETEAELQAVEAARAVLAGEKGALEAEARELVEFARKLQVGGDGGRG